MPNGPLNFPLGGTYPTLIPDRPGLTGLVDLHSHPMAHLGFGTELFYGAPDGNPAAVLSNCNPFHGGWGLFDNPGGNEIRRRVVDQMQKTDGVQGWDHKRAGYPSFAAWPSWHDRCHQQMWVDWIRRAWQGGLRVCVTLAVNNHALADAAETKGPYDDFTTGNHQIREAIAFVGRHSDFMEVAYSSSQLRDIVVSGKLAVVVGVELDCIGNFYRPANEHHSGGYFNPAPSSEQVLAEISRLHSIGVRYVFPLHITDNVLGGAAVYKSEFSIANRFTFGSHYDVQPAPAASDISFVHAKAGPAGFQSWLVLGEDYTTFPPIPQTTTGHRNVRGLTPLGETAIERLIKLGMIIDIDHMSELTVQKVLEIAEQTGYPLCAGHAGIRSRSSERFHTPATVRRLHALGGFWGIGIAGGLATLVASIRDVRNTVGSADFSVAIGSDACGLEQLPSPRFPGSDAADAGSRQQAGMVVYRDNVGAPTNALERCRTGNRGWDYSTEGCMHYGLLPDMLEEAVTSRLMGGEDLANLFSAAEGFAQMWAKCEAKSAAFTNNLWFTTRHAAAWDLLGVFDVPTLDHGNAIASAISHIGNDTHVCVVTSRGSLLHRSKNAPAGRWSEWGDVASQTGGARRFVDVSCAGVGGLLHVCAVTADGLLWHSIRRAESWDLFGDVRAQQRNSTDGFCRVTCTGIGGDLHVLGVTTGGALRYGIRSDRKGWTTLSDVESVVGDCGWVVACSVLSKGDSTVLFIVNGHGRVTRAVRSGNGRWDRLRDLEAELGGGEIGLVTDVSATLVGDSVHACCVTNKGDLFHTFEQPNRMQQFGNVKDAAGFQRFCTRVAATAAFGELQCLVLSD